MEFPEALPELLELHKDLVMLHQRWCYLARPFWKVITQQQRIECLQDSYLHQSTSPQHQVGLLLPPSWNFGDTAGPTSNLFALLDSAAGETLLRQASVLWSQSKPGNSAHDSMALVDKLTASTRFTKWCKVFEDYRAKIQASDRSMDPYSKDLRDLVKLFATMPPPSSGIIIEKLFLLHRNLYKTMKYIIKQIEARSLEPVVQQILKLRTKNEALLHDSIKSAVAATFSDPKSQYDHLRPLPGKVAVLTSIAQHLTRSASYISESIRTSNPAFVHARTRAIRKQPGLLGNAEAIKAELETPTGEVSSAALYDLFHEPIRYLALWKYLHRVLVLLQDRADDSIFRVIAIRELSEVCRLEYQRAKSALQRHAEKDMGPELKRMSTAADYTGNVESLLRVTAAELNTMENQLLATLVQFCRRSTTAPRAAKSFQKWFVLLQKGPETFQRLSQDTELAMQQLAAIVYFIQKCMTVISLDPNHRHLNQSFGPRFTKLQKTLNKARGEFVLFDTTLPNEILVRKGMARTYFYVVDEFTSGATGLSLEAHYQKVVIDSIQELKQRCYSVKAEMGMSVLVKDPAALKEDTDSPKEKSSHDTSKTSTSTAKRIDVAATNIRATAAVQPEPDRDTGAFVEQATSPEKMEALFDDTDDLFGETDASPVFSDVFSETTETSSVFSESCSANKDSVSARAWKPDASRNAASAWPIEIPIATPTSRSGPKKKRTAQQETTDAPAGETFSKFTKRRKTNRE